MRKDNLITDNEKDYVIKRLKMENELLRDFIRLAGKEVKATVKYLAIYRNKSKYPIKTMCGFFGVSRSGYYNYVTKLAKADKDEAIKGKGH